MRIRKVFPEGKLTMPIDIDYKKLSPIQIVKVNEKLSEIERLLAE